MGSGGGRWEVGEEGGKWGRKVKSEGGRWEVGEEGGKWGRKVRSGGGGGRGNCKSTVTSS